MKRMALVFLVLMSAGCASAPKREVAAPQGLSRGAVLEREGKWSEALAEYNKALSRDKSDGQAWQGLARIYEAQGNRRLALRCMNQAGILDPENPQILEWIEKHSRSH